MPLNEAYLIVQKPAFAYARYLDLCRKRGWLEDNKELRTSLPRLNPNAYRGISREPLTAHAFSPADIAVLREAGWDDVDINLAAQLRMFELRDGLFNDDEFDLSMLLDRKQAAEVYGLVDADQLENYEIIKIVNHLEASTADTLGYDVGYWGGDYFSIICDCALMPMWHPPAWDDLPELAQQLKSLNAHQLFDQIGQAVAFRKYYQSRPWAETVAPDDQFYIIRVDSCG